MSSPIKILIAGEEQTATGNIATQLKAPEYEACTVLLKREEILKQIILHSPDILLFDFPMKGRRETIETAVEIKRRTALPIIYLMADAKRGTFTRAMITRPAAFLSKPLKTLDLQRAIELAFFNCIQEKKGNHDAAIAGDPVILSDRIFVRCRDKMIKIMIAEILYIEADRNYSRIYTLRKEFLLSTTLKLIEERLPGELFIRIHRSYVVNLCHVDEVAESYVLIGGKPIPLSAAMREHLLERIQTL